MAALLKAARKEGIMKKETLIKLVDELVEKANKNDEKLNAELLDLLTRKAEIKKVDSSASYYSKKIFVNVCLSGSNWSDDLTIYVKPETNTMTISFGNCGEYSKDDHQAKVVKLASEIFDFENDILKICSSYDFEIISTINELRQEIKRIEKAECQEEKDKVLKSIKPGCYILNVDSNGIGYKINKACDHKVKVSCYYLYNGVYKNHCNDYRLDKNALVRDIINGIYKIVSPEEAQEMGMNIEL